MNDHLSGKGSILRTLMTAVALTMLSLLIYDNVLKAPFVFDDLPNITRNPDVRLTDLTPDKIVAATRGPSPFRPVAYLSFALNYHCNRYDPFGYHLVNIAIHVAVALLLFLIAGHTLQLTGIPRGRIPEAAALIWLTHPLHTQSVTYTVQRVNSLAVLFFMLALYLYIRARRVRRQDGFGRATAGLLFAGCIGSSLLALFSKEIAATLPVCLFLYEWFFLQPAAGDRAGGKFKWIFFGGGVLVILTALYLQADPIDKILSSYNEKDFTPLQRLLTEPRVIVYYLSLLFFPHPARLNVDYDFPLSFSLTTPAVTAPALLALCALLAAALYRPRHHRLLSFAVLWFLVNLMIESSVIGLALIFEHRTYLPSLFPVFVLTALLGRRLPRRLSLAVFCLVVIVNGFWTFQRNAVWSDPLTLWQDSARKSPHQARPASGVGVAYKARHQPGQSLKWFQKAVQLDPDYVEGYSNIGVILTDQGRPEEGLAYLERAIAVDHQNYEALSNLGSVLHRLGRIDDAIACYRKAIAIYPKYETAHSNLGILLSEKGDNQGAIGHLRRAIELNPEFAEAYNNLGLTYTRLGRLQDAIACYQRVLQLDPTHALAHFNLGTVWFQKKDLDRARFHLQAAVRLDPDSVLALNNLAAVLVMQKKYTEATEAIKRLTQIRPESATTYYNLACVFALQNKKAQAVTALKKAVDLGYDRWRHIKTDPDLENIHETDYFKRLLNETAGDGR